MSDFDTIKSNLVKTRSEKSALMRALYVHREALGRIRREIRTFENVINKKDQSHVDRLVALKRNEDEQSRAVLQAKEALRIHSSKELDIQLQYEALSDPRLHLGNLKDVYPILLMPLRLETRFKKFSVDNRQQEQLWIRIYPDDCMVDSFEEHLSESEISNAKFYWSKFWEAAGSDQGERAAWRTLVSSSGSGRAAYIISHYLPINAGEAPKRNNDDEIFLIIGVDSLPSVADQNALKTYWVDFWKAGDSKDAQLQAWKHLVAVTGEATATLLTKQNKPFNLGIQPPKGKTRNALAVQTIFLQFEDPKNIDTKLQSWSQPPKSEIMPDRFVAVAYEGEKKAFEVMGKPIAYPLIVGPDPGKPEGEEFSIDPNGDLVISAEMKWMIDFDEAVEKGMALKIDLTPLQARAGFSRIVVLGIKMSADELQGQQLLETLIDHQRQSRKGFSIIPQGSPTNNTEAEGAAHTSVDNPDDSYDELSQGQLFNSKTNEIERKDGQWLAESLGISHESLFKVSNAGHCDQAEARAMNIALWPATLGYIMGSMMQPVFSEEDIVATRDFFTRFVSGRGTVPAIKIGKQPYGILPTTAFSKMKFDNRDNQRVRRGLPGFNNSYIVKLHKIINAIDKDFDALSASVPHVEAKGDSHQILLDILALNASSVEFYQRSAKSSEDLYNRLNLMGTGKEAADLLTTGKYAESGLDLLKKFGYKGDEAPEILNKFFVNSQNLLKGPLIDDRPLSEIEHIRNYTPDPDAQNYIGWLIQGVQTSHDKLRRQEGFLEGKIPTALLYLMLHHALDLSYVEVSLILHQKAELISQQEAGRARIEPSFVHVQQGKRSTESRWQYLYSNPEVITGDAEVSVGAYIPTILKTEVATAYLYEQVKAMEVLKNVPTSRLERVFAEHIDCCSYRLDAWKGAIMNFRLSEMREASNPNNETYTKGIFLGAYGYLENLRPENKVLTPVALEDRSLNEIFIKDQNEQLVSDKTNGGYIMAPSLNHAVTASILRNGYISNDTPDALRVNLSSERVRKALSVIEGIRGGQSLGALLGYYLERGLHESHPGVELDYFIYQLRKAFPLVSNKNKDTKVDESSPQPISSVEAIEARNVIDGLAVIEQIKLSGTATYPFGKSFLPAVDVPAQATAINEEVQKIMDINDAVADVAIAESVHQIVQGNYDRGAATLDTFSKGNFPPIPDVIQTPRTGINITHRIGLQLKTGIDPAAGLTPRAQAEPAMNDWLKSVLPVAADIVCLASYGTVIDEIVSVSMLGLEPIDLLYLINTESDQAMKEIDDRVVKFILDKPLVRPDTQVSIDYMKRVAGKYSFFELAPLVKSLRSLLLASRPLQANDVLLPTSSPKNTPSQEFLNDQRLVLRYTKLFSVLNNELKALALASSTLVSDAVANRAQILAQADQLSQDLEKILFEMSASGLPQSGFGYIAEARGNVYRSVIKKFNEIISSWDTRMDAFDKLMDDYNSLGAAATIDEKFTILQRARSEVSTTAPLTLPADPDIYRGNVLAMRGLFASKQNELKAVTSATSKSVAQLLSDANAALVDVSNYDLTNRSVKPEEDQLIFFVQDIALKAKQLTDDLFARLAKTKTLIDEAGLTTDGTKRVKNLLEAGKLLFHEDFKIIPEFTVDDDTGQQWANSFAQRDLLMHYSNQEGIDFPEDNWLYGIARVREKMHHWENITLLCEAFGVEDMQLHPVQFPFVDNDSWLGLSFPSTYNIDSERLLYTAFYADGFDKAKKQCGLLVDEWTEVIPSKKETAGIAFHFDRPNTEPPQVMLLAMPSEFTGAWKWEDLLDTVIETFKMAKGRGIQPSQIDGTGYGRFLPAVISSMVAYPVTPSLNFSFNNNIHEQFLNLLHE